MNYRIYFTDRNDVEHATVGTTTDYDRAVRTMARMAKEARQVRNGCHSFVVVAEDDSILDDAGELVADVQVVR